MLLRSCSDEAGVGSPLILRNDKSTIILSNNLRQIVVFLVENPSAIVAEPVGSPRPSRVCR